MSHIDYDAITPTVITSENWGRDASARPNLNVNKRFTCVMIGSDSEAGAVELRPRGKDGYAERILVDRNNPYFGPLEGKGLGVFPVSECPADVREGNGNVAKFSHQMKLLLYPQFPGVVHNKRVPAKFSFQAGASGDAVTAAFRFPLTPAFGRSRAYFTANFLDISGAGSIDIIFEGGRVPPNNPDERMSRFWNPDGNDSSTWDGGSGIKWVTLYTESTVTATEDYSFQYEGDFDFYRVKTELTGSLSYALGVRTVLVDM